MSRTSLSLPPGSRESAITKRSDDPLEVNVDLERKAVRRIDHTVLPIITMFYLLSYLVSAPDIPQLDSGAKYIIQDRANIGD
jgi:hypothetical protein